MFDASAPITNIPPFPLLSWCPLTLTQGGICIINPGTIWCFLMEDHSILPLFCWTYNWEMEVIINNPCPKAASKSEPHAAIDKHQNKKTHTECPRRRDIPTNNIHPVPHKISTNCRCSGASISLTIKSNISTNPNKNSYAISASDRRNATHAEYRLMTRRIWHQISRQAWTDAAS